MNEHFELATALLAVAFSAVLVVLGHHYQECRAIRDVHNPTLGSTRQADVKEGLDIRLVEQSPYMRSER